jgi:hypothetical protein
MLLLLLRLTPIWLCFLSSFLLFLTLARRRSSSADFSICWMLATVLTGAAFMVVGEVASAFRRLTPGFILGAWIAVDLSVILALFLPAKDAIRQTILLQARAWLTGLKSKPLAVKLLLAASVAFVFWLGICAVRTPTSIWDCQTYHMPRIMHWLQQRSFRHYPTNIPRQLELSPGAEIAIAQLMLFAGDDTPAALVEWWALLTGAVACAFLSRKLLSSSAAKKPFTDPIAPDLCLAFALLAALTLPEAASESITAQNNVAATSCLLGSATALALGFAVKPTVALYLTPPIALAVVCLVWRREWLPAMRWCLAALFLAMAINGPWLARNQALFGAPLGPKDLFAVEKIAHNSPKKVAVNVLRNLSLYTRSPSETVTTLANFSIDCTVRLMGDSLDDTNAIFPSSSVLQIKRAVIARGEGFGNCFTLALLGVAICVFPARFKTFSPLGGCLLAAVASFVLFCGYLRYQPWHPRLHIACFLMALPFIGAVLCSWFDRWVTLIVGGFLLVNALLTVWFNPNVPAVASLAPRADRERLSFAARDNLREPTVAAVNEILRFHPANVLLKISDDSWEYPFWVLLKGRGFQGSIHHAGVQNISSDLVSTPTAATMTVLVSDVPVGSLTLSFLRQTNYGPWTIGYLDSSR